MVEEMTYWRNKKLISAYLGLVCILLCYQSQASDSSLLLLTLGACCLLSFRHVTVKKIINLNLSISVFFFEQFGVGLH